MNRIPSKTLGGTFELPGITITGVANITDTTTSGSPTTGALTVSGGVGIAGNLNVGGGITGGSISYSSTTTGSLAVTNTTQSNNTTTGAMTVAGGVGIAKNVNIGGETSMNALLHVGSPGSKEYLINLGRAGAGLIRTAYIYGGLEGNMNLWNQDPANLIMATNNTERMRITSTGLVGIGTATPTAVLDVAGQAITQALRVQSGGVNCDMTVSPTYGMILGTSGGQVISLKDQKVGINISSYNNTVDGTLHVYNNDYTTNTLNLEAQTTVKMRLSSLQAYETGFLAMLASGRIQLYTGSSSRILELQTTGGRTEVKGELRLSGALTSDTLTPVIGCTSSTYATPGVTIDNAGTASNTTFLIKTPSLPTGSETLVVVGKTLATNDALQLGFQKGATTATNEIVLSQYGSGNSGIRIKNNQVKIGSGAYFGYEEGTWTPQLWFVGGGAGEYEIPSGGYNSRSGTYVKIGKKVTLYYEVSFGYPASSSNSIVLTNLPYWPAYGTSINSQMSQAVELTGLGKPYYTNYEYGFSGSLPERIYFWNYANQQFVLQVFGAASQNVKGVMEFITS